MFVDLTYPDLRSRYSIDGISIGFGIGEIDGTLVDRDRGANVRLRLEGPVGAACLWVQRVDDTGVACHEQSPACNGRLGPRLRDIRDAKRPFEFQLRNICSAEPCLVLWLEARIGNTRSPSVPARTCRRICYLGYGS